MTPSEQKRFDTLYLRHQRALKLQGYAEKTIDVYSRAVRRLAGHYDCVPDRLSGVGWTSSSLPRSGWDKTAAARGLSFFVSRHVKRGSDWFPPTAVGRTLRVNIRPR
jgi:hypothetical protein